MKVDFKYLALALPLLFAGCTEKEMGETVYGEDMLMSIVAELPQESVATKAQISIPADYQLRCVAEVRDVESAVVSRAEKLVGPDETNVSFDFTLPGGDYTCLMWADIIASDAAEEEKTVGKETYTHYADKFYNTSDLTQVSVIGDGTALMDTDLCDAFFAKTELTGTNAGPYTVKLKRPSGKVTVTETDKENFGKMRSMEVSYMLPSAFNVSSGEPAGEPLAVKTTKNFDGQAESSLLFTTYAFASSLGTSMGMDFVFTMEDESKIANLIPGSSVSVKNNVQTNVSGELIKKTVIERDPVVGDFFFSDGTWGPLDAGNKDKCVGIVYAVGAQEGDAIENYGAENAGKKILGYVIAFKEVHGEPYKDILGDSHQGNYSRPNFYNKAVDADAALRFPNTPQGQVDAKSFNGYTETERLLATDLYKANQGYYQSLYILADWRKDKVYPNASGWYIPSIAQMMKAISGFYGIKEVRDFPEATADPALVAAMTSANDNGVSWGSWNKKMCNITINEYGDPVEIELNSSHAIHRYRNKYDKQWYACYLHPALTIIK